MEDGSFILTQQVSELIREINVKEWLTICIHSGHQNYFRQVEAN